MKNISERKQEAIKNAWVALIGEDKYPLLKHDDNGWSDWRCRGLMPSSYWGSLQDKLKAGIASMASGADLLYRPKSISGLETNNGWSRIESISDLPKIANTYMFLVDGREVNQWYEDGMSFPKSHTHWRDIPILPRPIF